MIFNSFGLREPNLSGESSSIWKKTCVGYKSPTDVKTIVAADSNKSLLYNSAIIVR